MTIDPSELMDISEVAAHLGVAESSIRVALTRPAAHPTLADRLPKPFRRIGNQRVWRRADIEAMDTTP